MNLVHGLTESIPSTGTVSSGTPASKPRDENTGYADDYSEVDPMLLTYFTLDPTDPGRTRLLDRIVQRCLPVATHIAQRFAGRGEAFEDLEQVARLGLVYAVQRFDPRRGSSFLSFAVPTMMGEVRRYFRDRSWALHVPRMAKENYLRTGPAIADLTARLGRAPTVKEIAARLGLSNEAVTDALLAGYAYSPDSIDSAPSGADDDRPLADKLAFEDSSYAHVDEYVTIKPLLAELTEKERAVLVMRFFENMTQSQIAARIGSSQMHVSRMLSRSLGYLRERATDESATEKSVSD